MSKQFVVMTERNGSKVFLVTGGGSFAWWTVHKSMASLMPAGKANALVTRMGGKAYEITRG